jgi:hypothetical protein
MSRSIECKSVEFLEKLLSRNYFHCMYLLESGKDYYNFCYKLEAFVISPTAACNRFWIICFRLYLSSHFC